MPWLPTRHIPATAAQLPPLLLGRQGRLPLLANAPTARPSLAWLSTAQRRGSPRQSVMTPPAPLMMGTRAM